MMKNIKLPLESCLQYNGRVEVVVEKQNTIIDIRDAFFDTLYDIAQKDRGVVFLTADMGAWSLNRFKEDMPGQFINVGIAEQNMVSVAAGLALGGKKVFIYSIVPFVTERCFEQIKIDICTMELPVTIIGTGPGLTYASDGPTHHAIEDVSVMRALPGMTIFSPCDQYAAAAAADLAYACDDPVYVRIDKGKQSIRYNKNTDFAQGATSLLAGADILLISTGIMTHRAMELADKLKERGIQPGVIDLFRIKPLSEDLLEAEIRKYKAIITLEEHTLIGGIGSAISELMHDKGIALPLKRVGIPDQYCHKYGSREWMQKYLNLDVNSVNFEIEKWLNKLSMGADKDISSASYDNKMGFEELKAKDFAYLFGTSVEEIPEQGHKVINECNFRYRCLSKEESNNIILQVLKKINSSDLSASGKERQNQWEDGWTENLRDFEATGYDLAALIPKYYRPNRLLRLDGEHVISEDDRFEFNFFRVLRYWVCNKYLKGKDAIFEFACGSGHNLPIIAELFPNAELYGIDWAEASVKIVDKIGEEYDWKMKGHLFNMFAPDYNLQVSSNSAFITFGGLEQLGNNYHKFIDFILTKKPSICINIEPIYELYNHDNLIDYLGMLFHKKRGYLSNYLTYLRQIEKEDRIRLINVKRVHFGGIYHDGWSLVIWRPSTQ